MYLLVLNFAAVILIVPEVYSSAKKLRYIYKKFYVKVKFLRKYFNLLLKKYLCNFTNEKSITNPSHILISNSDKGNIKLMKI